MRHGKAQIGFTVLEGQTEDALQRGPWWRLQVTVVPNSPPIVHIFGTRRGSVGSQAQHVMDEDASLPQLSDSSDPHTNDAFTHI